MFRIRPLAFVLTEPFMGLTFDGKPLTITQSGR